MKTKIQDNRNDRATRREKDMLFAAWSEDRQSVHPQPLRAWIGRYPQFADALIDWAADMPMLDCAIEKATSDLRAEAHTLAIGKMALAEMRAQYFASEFPSEFSSEFSSKAQLVQSETRIRETSGQEAVTNTLPLRDLIQAAKAQGLNGKALASQLGVGLPLVAKLNQRLIHLVTVPQELVDRLAATLQTSVEQVRDYLLRPATLSASAQYKSDSVPHVAPAEDFLEAVRACSDMTEEQKQYWLQQQN